MTGITNEQLEQAARRYHGIGAMIATCAGCRAQAAECAERLIEPGGVLLTAAEAAALGRVLDGPAILESGRRYCFVGHADAGALRAALARATGGG